MDVAGRVDGDSLQHVSKVDGGVHLSRHAALNQTVSNGGIASPCFGEIKEPIFSARNVSRGLRQSLPEFSVVVLSLAA